MIQPRVSVVIPTRNRPALVCRAVRSVLSQTSSVLECIVVIDGPDPGSEDALKAFEATTVKVVALEENVGGSEARNIGARTATGDWIAFLDDDDEWLPIKLEKQLAALRTDTSSVNIVFNRHFDRRANGDMIRPISLPRAEQPFSEHMFCDGSVFGGCETFVTSSWLVRREFIIEHPFQKGLRALQDGDWLLRASRDQPLTFIVVEDPLTILYNDHDGNRITKGIEWRFCHSWGMKNRFLFTRKAFGFFIAVNCLNRAAQQEATKRELLSLMRDCIRYGEITWKLCILCTLYVLVYPVIRNAVPARSLSALLYRVRIGYRSFTRHKASVG